MQKASEQLIEKKRDEVRARFWRSYAVIKFKEGFYIEHERSAYRWNLAYTIITLIVSIGSTLAWSIAQDLPTFWAFIIAAAQIALSIKDSLPWGQRLSVLKYLLPELRILLLDIEDTWNNIDISEDEWNAIKIDGKRSEYEHRFATLEAKYIEQLSFPSRKRIKNLATKEWKRFFKNRYDVVIKFEQE